MSERSGVTRVTKEKRPGSYVLMANLSIETGFKHLLDGSNETFLLELKVITDGRSMCYTLLSSILLLLTSL